MDGTEARQSLKFLIFDLIETEKTALVMIIIYTHFLKKYFIDEICKQRYSW